jgi:hypothetical protein
MTSTETETGPAKGKSGRSRWLLITEIAGAVAAVAGAFGALGAGHWFSHAAPPAQVASIEKVVTDVGQMPLRDFLDARQRSSPRYSSALGCDGIVYLVTLRLSGFHDNGPLLRWWLADASSQTPAPVAPGFRALQVVQVARTESGQVKLWVPFPPGGDGQFDPKIEVYVHRDDIPRSLADSKTAERMYTLPALPSDDCRP